MGRGRRQQQRRRRGVDRAEETRLCRTLAAAEEERSGDGRGRRASILGKGGRKMVAPRGETSVGVFTGAGFDGGSAKSKQWRKKQGRMVIGGEEGETQTKTVLKCYISKKKVSVIFPINSFFWNDMTCIRVDESNLSFFFFSLLKGDILVKISRDACNTRWRNDYSNEGDKRKFGDCSCIPM